MSKHCRHLAGAAALLGTLLLLPGCKNSDTGQENDFGPGGSVRGKVTYRGQPVLYGYVLFYPMIQPGGGKGDGQARPPAMPLAVAEIKDGEYQIDVPGGP